MRRLALDLWGRIHIDWGFAATRLAAVVRQERWLGSQERRDLLELLFGMIRQSRRLDYALEASGTRLPPGTPRELSRYLAYRLLSGGIDAAAARAEMASVDWEKVRAVDENIAHERDAARRLGLTHSLPDWLSTRLVAEYGDDAGALAAALNQRAPLTLRANIGMITRDALIERLRSEGMPAQPGLLAPHAIKLESRVDVFGLSAYAEGLFEVQDEGSQLIAEVVAVEPHNIVVDACAGSGGKTLALASAMQGKGRLLALDIDPRKLEELKKRARHAGLSSVQALHTAPDVWPRDIGALTSKVDRVLVDAPCTGTGALRRNPETRWRLADTDVNDFAAVQERLACRAAALLAPQGRLIYATCSLLRAENEAVVDRVLARVHGLELVPVADVLGAERGAQVCDTTGQFLKTAPHRHGTDGFFAAVFRRSGAVRSL